MSSVLRTMPRLGPRAGAALVLLIAAALAALLWAAASTAEVVDTVLVGHAQATVERTLTDRDPLLAGSAVVILSLGAGLATTIVTNRRWQEGAIVAAVVALAVGGGVYLLEDDGPSRPSRGVLSRTEFGSTARFTIAMNAAGLGCTEIRRASIDAPADAITCSVPWTADIRDGHDDLLVAVWRSGDPNPWLRMNVDPSTPAVAGRNWIATCEFRSTCALIGDRLREVEH